MYIKTTSTFFGKTTTFYKRGRVVARRRDGEAIKLVHPYRSEIELTRAQGYRYWKRYFPMRSCRDLPFAIAVAVGLEPEHFGTYINRKGEKITYAG